FFQAEDGIRDFHVTGVQTCALPILGHARGVDRTWSLQASSLSGAGRSDDRPLIEQDGDVTGKDSCADLRPCGKFGSGERLISFCLACAEQRDRFLRGSLIPVEEPLQQSGTCLPLPRSRSPAGKKGKQQV